MLTDQIAQGADALSWNIATSRWLRRELQACEQTGDHALVLSRDDLVALLGGLVCTHEVLADVLRMPGYLDATPPPSNKPAVSLRVIEGGRDK